DRDGALAMLNESGRAVLGWSEARTPALDELGLCSTKRAPLDLREHALERVLRGERSVHEELLLPRPGEEPWRHGLFSASGVPDAQGGVRLAIVLLRDVTHLRELERTREQYLALISHALRSPLSTATTIASFMSSRLAEERDRALSNAL